MTFVDHGLIFNLNLPWYNHGAPEYVKNKYHGLLIKYGRCTYILRTWYFHCQIWLTGYAMVARLTVFRHVKMVSCWIMYHVIRRYYDLQDVSFNLAILWYSMIISLLWHGSQLVNHHIMLLLKLIQTWFTMFQLCWQQLGRRRCYSFSGTLEDQVCFYLKFGSASQFTKSFTKYYFESQQVLNGFKP